MGLGTFGFRALLLWGNLGGTSGHFGGSGFRELWRLSPAMFGVRRSLGQGSSSSTGEGLGFRGLGV